MIKTPVLNIVSPIQTDDWLLVVLIVIFLLSFLVFIPRRDGFFKLVGSMYKFKNPDTDVYYPQLTPAGFLLVSVLSCVSMSLMFTCMSLSEYSSTADIFLELLCFLACVATGFIVKLALYQIVNSRMYRKQTTSLKPTRWNSFFLSAFSVAGNLTLILCVLLVFFSIPPIFARILFALTVILLEIGLIFKIKTALFRKKGTILIFFLYFCALEIGPIALTAVLWRYLIS